MILQPLFDLLCAELSEGMIEGPEGVVHLGIGILDVELILPVGQHAGGIWKRGKVTLYVLNCFEETQNYIWIVYHFLILGWHIYLKYFILRDKDQFAALVVNYGISNTTVLKIP